VAARFVHEACNFAILRNAVQKIDTRLANQYSARKSNIRIEGAAEVSDTTLRERKGARMHERGRKGSGCGSLNLSQNAPSLDSREFIQQPRAVKYTQVENLMILGFAKLMFKTPVEINHQSSINPAF
jgi:hypothetical protein